MKILVFVLCMITTATTYASSCKEDKEFILKQPVVIEMIGDRRATVQCFEGSRYAIIFGDCAVSASISIDCVGSNCQKVLNLDPAQIICLPGGITVSN